MDINELKDKLKGQNKTLIVEDWAGAEVVIRPLTVAAFDAHLQGVKDGVTQAKMMANVVSACLVSPEATPQDVMDLPARGTNEIYAKIMDTIGGDVEEEGKN